MFLESLCIEYSQINCKSTVKCPMIIKSGFFFVCSLTCENLDSAAKKLWSDQAFLMLANKRDTVFCSDSFF